MKFVFIIGNGAVGKMTVGRDRSKTTDLRLFHNHMTIEPVIEIFDYFDSEASPICGRSSSKTLRQASCRA